MLDAAAPVWKSFERLSKRRAVTAFGVPCPVLYRDIRDESERASPLCGLPPQHVQDLLANLDDVFLERAAKDEPDRRSGDR